MSSRPNILRPSKRFFSPFIHCGGIDHLSNECLYYTICKLCGSYDHDTNGHNMIISLERKINPRNPQHAFKKCEACGIPSHTTTDHYDIEWFKRGKALQAKKYDIRKPIWYLVSGCSRHMTGVKSYLHKYMEQPGPKMVFGDDSTCTIKGYGSIKCNGIVFIKFDDKRGTIFNSNKEIIMIAPRANKRKNRTLIEAARTMLLGYVFSKQYWTEAVATACYTQNRSTIIKRHLKTPYEIFRKGIPNIGFLYVFRCPIYIHNHKDYLGKFDEKADDGYLLGYSLVSKTFKVFKTRRKQTEETYHITFDESPEAIKFSKPSVDNINIVESERHPPDEFLHPYKPSQSHTNDEQIIDSLPNTKDIQIFKHLSSLNTEDTSTQNTTIPRAGMLTRSMAKQLSAASAHECLFIDFLFEEEPKKVFEALKHLRWVDAMQDKLNQFSRNKVWTLDPAPYGKIIIGSRWQEGIDYDETFALVARLEDIKIFLAFATYMNFIVYQMDVKSAFLDDKLKEKVYVKQPPGFESNEFPNHVCKLDKALYRFKQVPRAWFDLKGYSDSDYAGCNMDRKSTPSACQLLRGGLDQISNKDATILYCLANDVQVDYANIIWEDLIHKLYKKTREKIVPYPRFISILLERMAPKYDNEELIINPTQVFRVYKWILKPNQPEEPSFTDHMKAICNLDVPMDSKAPKYSSSTEEVPQGKNPGARSGLRRKQSSKHISESTTEASKS
nr:retrovirus-related Pol polyprotein from transposon TNT 1-94 [Tanacetum cinerariifolium]